MRLRGHKVVLDYFAQDQAAVLNPARTVLEEMSSASSVSMAPMIRTILGGFLFEADDVFKKVAVLSGGERNRLALAKMLLTASNVLLLDEPTNHLDLDSKEVLLDALDDYGGTLVFVSHDRYFVDKLATKVIEVGGGEAPLYPGGYEDFLYWKTHLALSANSRAAARGHGRRDRLGRDGGGPPESPPQGPLEGRFPPDASYCEGSRPQAHLAEARKASPHAPLRPRPIPSPPVSARPAPRPSARSLDRELKKTKVRLVELEKRVTEKEQAVKALEAQMAEPGFYEDREQSAKAAEEHQKLMWETGDLMAQWEALQAEVDEKARQGAALTPAPRR